MKREARLTIKLIWFFLPPPPPSNRRGCGWRPDKNPSRNSSSNNTTYSIGQNPNSETSFQKSQISNSKILWNQNVWKEEFQKISERRNSRKSSLFTRKFVFLQKFLSLRHWKLWWFWDFNKKLWKLIICFQKTLFWIFRGHSTLYRPKYVYDAEGIKTAQ